MILSRLTLIYKTLKYFVFKNKNSTLSSLLISLSKMAQAYVRLYKFKEISTQTDDLNFSLTQKKTARMYFSQAYKERVLSLNFGTSKNFIITKHMWQNFKKEFKNIENVFDAEKQNNL
jgi:hypothetical protein